MYLIYRKQSVYSGLLNSDCYISDVHNFIGATNRRFVPLRKPRHVFYRSYRNFDDADLCRAVSSTSFHVSDIFEGIEDMAWFTSSVFSTIINEHAPMKRKYIRQESVPYMNARLRNGMYSKKKMLVKNSENTGSNIGLKTAFSGITAEAVTKEIFSEKCIKKDANFWETSYSFRTDKN